VTYLLAHQANKRIIDYTAEKMNLPSEKVLMNIERYGNTPVVLYRLLFWDFEKRLKKATMIIWQPLAADSHGVVSISNGLTTVKFKQKIIINPHKHNLHYGY
jgi:3-oxoacyl-[acyl-carrier-protein] synthase III